MGPIPFHTTQSFNFSFPPIWDVSNEMELHIINITILPLFYFSLPLLKYPYVTWERLYFFTKLYFYTLCAGCSFTFAQQPNKICHFLLMIVCSKIKLVFFFFIKKKVMHFAIICIFHYGSIFLVICLSRLAWIKFRN
jgi:hypothetical protein